MNLSDKIRILSRITRGLVLDVEESVFKAMSSMVSETEITEIGTVYDRELNESRWLPATLLAQLS